MIATCENITITPQGEELDAHGTPLFPLVCYEEDVSAAPVPWHWHDDWEVIQSIQDTVRVLTTSGNIDLQPGQALFLGARCVHEVTGSGERAMLRSVVFHPRFLGSMDSIIWQKYVHPLQNAGAVPLNSASPWQRACIEAFSGSWAPGSVLPRLTRNAASSASGLCCNSSRNTIAKKSASRRLRTALWSAKASACGFTDAAYFTKTFRETKGCTPSEYRRAHRPL